MKMFVANCTNQDHDFIYRMPEDNKPRRQRIKSYAQVVLSGDLTQQHVDAIVKQHVRYGFVPASEIDRTKTFSGLCYSLDKPIPAGIMFKLLDHNKTLLVEEGRKNRREAAVAVSNNINEQTGGGLENLEVEVVEETKGDKDEGTFEEHVRVTRHVGRDNEIIPRSERRQTRRERRNKK